MIEQTCVFFFFLLFVFEVIMDLQEVAKYSTVRSCASITHFLPMAASYTTLVVLLAFKHLNMTIHSLVLSSVYSDTWFECHPS